ncbi:MAG: peptide ABC transporter substrate-binding protein [Spirochaetae bacterium HGW-Spirochaetae-3]|nr:MAG: peptide ABC transporter substrate-binding protein [Spirochaetae bacterium HGW-Spirochaetae-3]
MLVATAILACASATPSGAWAQGGADKAAIAAELPEGAEFTVCNGSEPLTLDPSRMTSVSEHTISMALFEGLVTYDPRTARAVPGIARSWAYSEGGSRITFTLRDASWSDGTPITAATVVDSWLRTLDPKTGSEYAYLLGMVIRGADAYSRGRSGEESVGIRALDARRFQCDLVGPMPYAVDMMAHPVFSVLPMHAIRKYGDEWFYPERFVGNGPFVLAAWIPEDSIEVVPNERYWDAGAVGLSRVVYLPIDDQAKAYGIYERGEADWAHGVPLARLDEIRLRPDYHVAPQIATYYYYFNLSRAPLDDVRVRKALAMALDMEELVDTVNKGGQLPAASLVPAMDGYESVRGAAFDVAGARRLLAQAGFPDGQGFPAISVVYNTLEGHKRIAEWVQRSWKKNLGIDVTLVTQDWRSFLGTRSDSHDFYIARAGWVGDYLDPNTFLDMFIIGSGNNDGLYSNKRYDELLRRAATMKAGPARMDVLRKAETILILEDQAVIPFYYYVEQDLIDLTRWDGWYSNPLGVHNLKFVTRRAAVTKLAN